MGWNDKALQKHRLHKQIEQALNEPVYKEIRKQWERQAMLQGFVNFILVSLDWLELECLYEREDFIKFLKFTSRRMQYVGENEAYFEEMTQHYKDEFNLDVLDIVGIEKAEKEKVEQTMKTIERTQNIVKQILDEEPKTRNCDELLYLKVCERLNEDAVRLPFDTVVSKIKDFSFPPFKSVERCRRKLQAQYPELSANDKVKKHRKEQEEKYKEYAKAVN